MKPDSLSSFGELIGLKAERDVSLSGYAIDSRKVEKGDLFFALSGNRIDGHTFIPDAIKRGAAAAVVLESFVDENISIPLLRVPSVLEALQKGAQAALKKRSSKVIAITGSLGKTTTKTFITALLSQKYKVFASPQSYNSQVTLPLSILMSGGDEEYLILEMGMSEPGQIQKLVEIAPPDYALLTAIAVQHVVHFKDGLEGIAKEKAAIFTHPKTTLGLLSRDLPFFDAVYQTGRCQKKTFSLQKEEADYFLKMPPQFFSCGRAVCELPIELPIQAHYQNALAACALAFECGIEAEQIRQGASTFKLPPMRFEAVEKKGILFINDAYNANPDAMIAAIQSLPKPQACNKTVAILSEMDALGPYCTQGHAQVAATALKYVDFLICIGKRCEVMYHIWKKEKRKVKFYFTRAEAETELPALLESGDVVLLKGARLYALENILTLF